MGPVLPLPLKEGVGVSTKHCRNSCCGIYTCIANKAAVRKMRAQIEEEMRETETALLYWTGVPLPWQPAALDWYLEQQVELLQRI